ncbi:uncharacterized protein J3R85_015186 [Psidium guajava]|nr:uncharacterized protein J3R85_015186 [Psidium guajava]
MDAVAIPNAAIAIAFHKIGPSVSIFPSAFPLSIGLARANALRGLIDIGVDRGSMLNFTMRSSLTPWHSLMPDVDGGKEGGREGVVTRNGRDGRGDERVYGVDVTDKVVFRLRAAAVGSFSRGGVGLGFG